MKLNISKEKCLELAKAEGDSPVSAGTPFHNFTGTVVRVEPDGFGVVKFDKDIHENWWGVFSPFMSNETERLHLREGMHVSGACEIEDSWDVARIHHFLQVMKPPWWERITFWNVMLVLFLAFFVGTTTLDHFSREGRLCYGMVGGEFSYYWLTDTCTQRITWKMHDLLGVQPNDQK